MKVLRLLLYNGRDTHGFLQHDDADLQVHAEVHHDPVDALRDLLLLLHQNCCSSSLTKLMEIYSKPLYSKISKPVRVLV